jgi:hypothetical protein
VLEDNIAISVTRALGAFGTRSTLVLLMLLVLLAPVQIEVPIARHERRADFYLGNPANPAESRKRTSTQKTHGRPRSRRGAGTDGARRAVLASLRFVSSIFTKYGDFLHSGASSVLSFAFNALDISHSPRLKLWDLLGNFASQNTHSGLESSQTASCLLVEGKPTQTERTRLSC